MAGTLHLSRCPCWRPHKREGTLRIDSVFANPAKLIGLESRPHVMRFMAESPAGTRAIVTISPLAAVGVLAEMLDPTSVLFLRAAVPAVAAAWPMVSYWEGRSLAVDAAASLLAMPSIRRAVAPG